MSEPDTRNRMYKPNLCPNRRAAFSGAFAMSVVAPAPRRGRVDFLEGLSKEDRHDVLRGGGRVDVARRLANLIASASPGAVIDASALSGRIHLRTDPFADILVAPVILQTGDVIFTYDFNVSPIQLPSQLDWRLSGTVLRPSRPVVSIPTDSSPASALVQTRVVGGTARGRAGNSTILVDYPVGLAPGCLLAILGAEANPYVTHRLESGLSAADQRVRLTGATRTLSNSTVYLRIGSETILVKFGGGETGLIEERGALGSPIASHRSGAEVTLMGSFVAAITALDGNRVTLDRPLLHSVAGAPFRCGALSPRLSGSGLIDGRTEQRGDAVSVWHCLASTLSNGLQIDGRLSLTGGAHGGLMLFGARAAEASLDSISECGRPERGLGASIWLFGDSRDNVVTVRDVQGGALAIALDNKSHGVTYFGLDRSPRGNSVRIQTVGRHDTLYDISGASENLVQVAVASTRLPSVIHSGLPQTTIAVPTHDNTIMIGNLDAQPRPIGDSVDQNTVIQG